MLSDLWIFLFSIGQVTAISYNQPDICSTVSWNPNATTVANISTIGSRPYDIFIDTNNEIYVPNQENNQIIVWSEGNMTSFTNISGNLFNSSSLFVTTTGDMYVDTFHTIGGVSKITLNSTIMISRINMCQQCWDIFIDINNLLYCSLNERHQIIARSLNNNSNPATIVGGTGSAGFTATTLNNPRGIFVDTNFDLYVADCNNDRIQLFSSGKRRATTIVGNGSLNFTITLKCPTSIILDANEYLYIVDSGNHRIVGSNASGFQCLVGCSGLSGSSSDQLNNPWSLSFDSYGNIFVNDQGNSRVQKFSQLTDNSTFPFYGVQLNFDPLTLPSGWSSCYTATYGSAMNSSIIASILSSCYGNKLLLGCRPVGNTSLTVAAMGNRADVLYNCGTTSTCTHVANGVGWYFSDSYSWGFVKGNDSVTRTQCDTASTNDTYRLCWHTQSSGGYRCGSTTGLNSDSTWQKVIYHSN